MNISNKIINYIKASQQELKKVIWPSQKEIIQHTLLVIGISLGVSVFLGVIDYILTLILEVII
ncbi:MAG: preprotein translocase subunit SecE [Candidatus Buchananbacteria bacterium RIFCSPHIGHO2_01_FULL_39_14]|uniref:Protein translocase subunit SecE n=2 Tax=Candidatus Buchananiibacteriota TaxID=1817903 RepID=A0A1G1YTI1_9BACT|nr:MAG: preprotein translocase subunit SecE [Candidatus Buchananbacteria bacterium RIFCSPHIGHO2_01_FULL_39_14]OGY49415.1 MAG: preprotein translocase subunit SecE [Candidatus Buchananbacteria bacterium RIFCSPHIGHO2_02_FULL_39_17]OGY55662.1 MAG: preprotein translocase subunit SecE [Candidatus Buchananbacteria bacterium RIFCSPLOWO2_01_FULL_40_23b]